MSTPYNNDLKMVIMYNDLYNLECDPKMTVEELFRKFIKYYLLKVLQS